MDATTELGTRRNMSTAARARAVSVIGARLLGAGVCAVCQ